ncbi:hypothetical protein EIP91_008064 [Steccherinum ochraceum]|uniref:F-box domain-containing protein n=1 Tax=Steccherinum ochraceum TaxID=92696 RepID=A0A4R0RUB4_9APHY|nr:hypothetical protein EIP91_008064 [Steccherinum ochraceum]
MRSKKSSLEVRLDDTRVFETIPGHQDPSVQRSSVQLLSQHVERITVLSLAQRHQDLEYTLSFLFDSVPRLRTLELIALAVTPGEPVAGGWDRSVPSMRVSIPCISTSPLKRLVLRNCQFGWAPNILPRTLTHLSILTDNYRSPPKDSQTTIYADILDVIATLPLLAHLHLQCHLPAAAFEEVSLPRLANLQIDDHAQTCLYLLQHLVIPAAATINIRLQSFFATYISELTAWLASRTGAEKCIPNLRPYRNSRYDRDFAIDTVTGFGWREPDSNWVLRDALPRLWDWVQNVTTLEVIGGGCFGLRNCFPFMPQREVLWRALLHSMPNITRIVMSADIRLPTLLAEPLGRANAHDGGSVQTLRYPLPRLTAIKLVVFAFAREPKAVDMRKKTSLLDWRDTLRTRKNAGCADVSMVLSYCSGVVEEHLALLREVAQVEQIKSKPDWDQ